jgi:hypothetical protein
MCWKARPASAEQWTVFGVTRGWLFMVNFSIVDIGEVRYFDARRFTCDAFVGDGPFDVACHACERLPAVAVHVWVLPHGFECFLPTLEPAAIALLFSRFNAVARGCPPGSLLADSSRSAAVAAKAMAYIDGWAADAASAALARQCGVELLQEWPRLVGSTTSETVQDILDRAANKAPPSAFWAGNRGPRS